MPTHFIQANTNGRLHAADEPSIPPLNRGYLYGDAIYEVWRTHDGVIFAWEEHWARLERSARALYFELPLTVDAMLAEIRRTAAAYRQHTGFVGELYIRLQVTRGTGAIGLDTKLAERTDFLLLVQPCPVTTPKQESEGLVLSVATSLRRNPVDCLSPAWKTGNYLNNILCLREARARGADEVVILNLAGEVTEAAVCNIGFIQGNRVITPPLSAGILGGITRALMISQLAKAVGVEVSESTVRPEDFAGMDECFLLSTTKNVAAVSAIDGNHYKVGSDTVTTRLKAAYVHYIRGYVAAHPARRV